MVDSNGGITRRQLSFAQSPLGSGACGLVCDGRNAYRLATLMIQRPTKISDCESSGIEEQDGEAATGKLRREEREKSRLGTATRSGIDRKRKEKRVEKEQPATTTLAATLDGTYEGVMSGMESWGRVEGEGGANRNAFRYEMREKTSMEKTSSKKPRRIWRGGDGGTGDERRTTNDERGRF
ncbi:hypothetical protein NLG97_g5052 [Lecanicillium saksenae]|uniref:Uncharacterized protein n=1 Tax=Lecanicillium saksenae TaxID=468837 RepID=A0ACC1QTI4_9HYPO|nr:hypothetical protein NLG97_g5052 [Lecanicillium saksenae]